MVSIDTNDKPEGVDELFEDGLQYIVVMSPVGGMKLTLEAAPDAADYVKDAVKDSKEEVEGDESSTGTWSITGDDTVQLAWDNGNVMPGSVEGNVMTIGAGGESFTYHKIG